MRTCARSGRTPPPRHPAAGTGCGWPSPPWTCCQRDCAGTSTASSSKRGPFSPGRSLPADGQTGTDVALSCDLKAVALLNLGVTEAWSLRLADSERHLLEGAALARRIGRPYLEVACLAHLGFASTSHSFAVARQRCEEAIALAARHGWDAEPVIAPALAALANALIWTGQFDLAEHWLDRARRATQADGEPGIRLLVCLTSAILQAARGHCHRALEEFAAAGRMQALMVGEHGLTTRVQCLDDRHPGPARDGRAGAGCSGRPRRPAGQRRRDPQRGRGDPAGPAGPRRRPPRTARRPRRHSPRSFLPHPGRGAPPGRARLPRPG